MYMWVHSIAKYSEIVCWIEKFSFVSYIIHIFLPSILSPVFCHQQLSSPYYFLRSKFTHFMLTSHNIKSWICHSQHLIFSGSTLNWTLYLGNCIEARREKNVLHLLAFFLLGFTSIMHNALTLHVHSGKFGSFHSTWFLNEENWQRFLLLV